MSYAERMFAEVEGRSPSGWLVLPYLLNGGSLNDPRLRKRMVKEFRHSSRDRVFRDLCRLLQATGSKELVEDLLNVLPPRSFQTFREILYYPPMPDEPEKRRVVVTEPRAGQGESGEKAIRASLGIY